MTSARCARCTALRRSSATNWSGSPRRSGTGRSSSPADHTEPRRRLLCSSGSGGSRNPRRYCAAGSPAWSSACSRPRPTRVLFGAAVSEARRRRGGDGPAATPGDPALTRCRVAVLLMSEGALRWQAGSPEVMLEQIAAISAAIDLPNVDVGIIPFSAPRDVLPEARIPPLRLRRDHRRHRERNSHDHRRRRRSAVREDVRAARGHRLDGRRGQAGARPHRQRLPRPLSSGSAPGSWMRAGLMLQPGRVGGIRPPWPPPPSLGACLEPAASLGRSHA